VLVADDTEIVRLSLARGLSLLGCTVHSASDGAQALALARRNPYELILLDLNMGGMGGREAARAIARDHRARGLDCPRIVAISAELGTDNPEDEPGEGLVGLLAKPVRLEHLAALIGPGRARPDSGSPRSGAPRGAWRDLVKSAIPAE
jgi:CheY-like chemotaxis protein